MTSPIEPLRAVLVGCGGISGAWLSSAACRESVRIVGAVDLRIDAAAAVRDRHRIAADAVVGTDLDAVLERTRPEAVFDLTVPGAHADVACAALARGCHVLGEKPLAAGIDDARRIAAAARASGRIHAVTQTRRWNRRLQQLRALIAGGTLGEIRQVHADFAIAADFGGFRAAMEHVLLVDMAIHTFDAARQLMPGAQPLSAIADEWDPPGSRYRHGAAAAAIFDMGGGRRFTYHGTWTASGAQTAWDASWRIDGTLGAATWDGGDGIAAQRLADPRQPSAAAGGPLIRDLVPVELPPVPEIRAGHDGAIHDFIQAIRSGRPPACPAEDAFASLAMVLAAVDSAGSGARAAVARL